MSAEALPIPIGAANTADTAIGSYAYCNMILHIVQGVVILYKSRKTRFASEFYVHGVRGCRNPNPGDVAETRGFALSVLKAKKV